VAWKMTVDMRLGLFAKCSDDSCSVPGCHADDYQPTVTNIAPHNLWTRVSLFFNSSLAHLFSSLQCPAKNHTFYYSVISPPIDII